MTHTYHALNKNVLAVAVHKGVEWLAYIDAVLGRNHDIEAQDVLNSGTLLNEQVVRAIFDELPWSELPYGGD